MLKTVKIKKFRKFNNLPKFTIGSRLTLISGANGIGKSTLLGIIASGSGTKHFKNLQNKEFHPEFKKYFILNKDEFPKRRNDSDEYLTILEYEYKSHKIYKRLKLSHPASPKLVPRTTNEDGVAEKDYVSAINQNTGITDSGRIPIPTYYLSTSRLFPFGESDTTEDNNTHVKERQNLVDTSILIDKYVDMYNKVLPRSISTQSENILVQTTKPKVGITNFYVPLQSAKILTQSIGQDSLSGILNALLAFYNIKDKDDYKGGILCIDELDISLHPDAQKRLLSLLSEEANALNLQVLFTSHSLTLIKEMLKLKKKNPEQNQVLYFRNSTNPLLKNDDTYPSIKADLFSSIHYQSPKVKVYFEDAEALFIHEQLIEAFMSKRNNQRSISLDCELIASQIGCDTLLKLPEKDDYFNSVVLVLDGDAKYNKSPKLVENLNLFDELKNLNSKKNLPSNACFLPGDFSPEGVLYRLLLELTKNENSYKDFWEFVKDSPSMPSGNYYPSLILNELEDLKSTNGLNREDLKIWFNRHISFFKQSKILEYYFDTILKDENIIEDYVNDFSKKVNIFLERMKAKGF